MICFVFQHSQTEHLIYPDEGNRNNWNKYPNKIFIFITNIILFQDKFRRHQKLTKERVNFKTFIYINHSPTPFGAGSIHLCALAPRKQFEPLQNLSTMALSILLSQQAPRTKSVAGKYFEILCQNHAKMFYRSRELETRSAIHVGVAFLHTMRVKDS